METMHVITIDEFRDMLRNSSPVTFQFFKKDNTARLAIGTLNEKFIPAEMLPKDASKNSSKNVKFFDLEKNAWRSIPTDCNAVTILE
jgi:hypothetical protein